MFKTKIFLMSFVAVLGSALIGLMLSTKTDAANPEIVTVQVAFVAPISMGIENNPLQFGSLDVAMLATETVTINPDDSFSEIPAGGVIGGVQLAASIDATATPGRPINILVDLVVDGGDYALSAFICDYNAGADVACDGGGMQTTSVASPTEIRVGATLTANGLATEGDDPGSFRITVSYE